MEPIIDHIEITVKDMGVAVPFYDKLLPLLGFDAQERVSAAYKSRISTSCSTLMRGWDLPLPHREAVSPPRRSIEGNQGRSIISHSRRHLAPKSTGSIPN